jgi:hypothetical protein
MTGYFIGRPHQTHLDIQRVVVLAMAAQFLGQLIPKYQLLLRERHMRRF